MVEELKNMISSDEQIFYEGKPDKKCFLFEAIINPMLPFAIVWALFDSIFLKFGFGAFPLFWVFLLFHMFPVWMYLGGVIFSFRKYKNAYYIVTDRALYVSSGVFTVNLNTKPFADLSYVNVHRGIFDQFFGVGDILISSDQLNVNSGSKTTQSSALNINSIKDYARIYRLIKQLQEDVYSDTMYPNDLRPEENHGYQTKYHPNNLDEFK